MCVLACMVQEWHSSAPAVCLWLQTLPGTKRTMQGQQAVMDLDTAWHHEQLADAHEVCDKLGHENEYLRAELAKRGVVLEADDEHSFALGGVPDQPHHSVSFSDSATTSHPGTTDGKPGASEMGDSLAGMGPALLSVARQSDAACSDLQQMIDRLQSQLTASTSAPSPMASRSPFAVVAAGSKEDQVRATKKLCGEASTQAVEVRTHLSMLLEALQQAVAGDSTPDRRLTDAAAELPREQAPPPPPIPAWRHSYDSNSTARSSIEASPRGSFDVAGVRGPMEAKSKQSVSFQTLDQPAYSANLDSFLPGSKVHGTSSLDNDYDTSQVGNPLFDTTLPRDLDRVEGMRGVALTRASVAAHMMHNLSHDDAEAQEQLAQAVREVQQQVSTSSLMLCGHDDQSCRILLPSLHTHDKACRTRCGAAALVCLPKTTPLMSPQCCASLGAGSGLHSSHHSS